MFAPLRRGLFLWIECCAAWYKARQIASTARCRNTPLREVDFFKRSRQGLIHWGQTTIMNVESRVDAVEGAIICSIYCMAASRVNYD